MDLVQATVQHCTCWSVSTQHRLTAGFSTVCSSRQKTSIDKLLWTSQNESVKTLKTFAYCFAVEKNPRLYRLFWIRYLQFSRQFLSSCSKFTQLHIWLIALRNRNILAYCGATKWTYSVFRSHIWPQFKSNQSNEDVLFTQMCGF